MINEAELESLNRGDARRYTQESAHWEIKRLRDELEQAMTVLSDIASQSKCDELGDHAKDADFEGAYDIMIQLARSVTTKNPREEALQDLADNDEDLIDWCPHLQVDKAGHCFTCGADVLCLSETEKD